MGGCFNGDDSDEGVAESDTVSSEQNSEVVSETELEPENVEVVSEDIEEEVPEPVEVVPKIEYTIVESTVDGLDRVSYWVRLDTRIITEENIYDITKEIIETNAKNKGYTSMFFSFVGPSDNIGDGYTVAGINYAPDGEFEGYSKAKSDYSNFEYFNGHIVVYTEKTLPPEQEFKISAEFEQTLYEMEYDYEKECEMGFSEYLDYREETAAQPVASKYGITVEEVFDIDMKIMSLRFSNDQEFL